MVPDAETDEVVPTSAALPALLQPMRAQAVNPPYARGIATGHTKRVFLRVRAVEPFPHVMTCRIVKTSALSTCTDNSELILNAHRSGGNCT